MSGAPKFNAIASGATLDISGVGAIEANMTFEATTPDFVARAWLGDLYASEYTFRERTTDRASTLVPMNEVVAAGDSTVIVCCVFGIR